MCVPLILNHHPAGFAVHRPNGTGNNDVCCISSNSNSISNVKVPMPRFTNGLYILMKKVIILKKIHEMKSFVPRFFTIESTSGVDLLHTAQKQKTSIDANAGIAKMKQEK